MEWEALRQQMDEVEERECELSHYAAREDGSPLGGTELLRIYGATRHAQAPSEHGEEEEDGATRHVQAPSEHGEEEEEEKPRPAGAPPSVAEEVLRTLRPFLERIEARIDDAVQEAREREEATQSVMGSFVETLRSIESLLGSATLAASGDLGDPEPHAVDSSRSPSARSAGSGPREAPSPEPAPAEARKDSLGAFFVAPVSCQELVARRLSALRVQAEAVLGSARHPSAGAAAAPPVPPAAPPRASFFPPAAAHDIIPAAGTQAAREPPGEAPPEGLVQARIRGLREALQRAGR